MTIDPQPNEVIIPGQNVSQAQMLALLTDLVGTIESFQSVTTVVYVSEAAMNADLTPAADTLAITADSLKTWSKVGSSGTGSWSLNSNALAALQALIGADDTAGALFGRVGDIEALVGTDDSGGAVIGRVSSLEGRQSIVPAAVSGTLHAIALDTPAGAGTIGLADGLAVRFTPAGANTGAVTIALNGGSARALVRDADAAALEPAVLGTAPIWIVYSAADDHWRMAGGAATAVQDSDQSSRVAAAAAAPRPAASPTIHWSPLHVAKAFDVIPNIASGQVWGNNLIHFPKGRDSFGFYGGTAARREAGLLDGTPGPEGAATAMQATGDGGDDYVSLGLQDLVAGDYVFSLDVRRAVGADQNFRIVTPYGSDNQVAGSDWATRSVAFTHAGGDLSVFAIRAIDGGAYDVLFDNVRLHGGALDLGADTLAQQMAGHLMVGTNAGQSENPDWSDYALRRQDGAAQSLSTAVLDSRDWSELTVLTAVRSSEGSGSLTESFRGEGGGGGINGLSFGISANSFGLRTTGALGVPPYAFISPCKGWQIVGVRQNATDRDEFINGMRVGPMSSGKAAWAGATGITYYLSSRQAGFQSTDSAFGPTLVYDRFLSDDEIEQSTRALIAEIGASGNHLSPVPFIWGAYGDSITAETISQTNPDATLHTGSYPAQLFLGHDGHIGDGRDDYCGFVPAAGGNTFEQQRERWVARNDLSFIRRARRLGTSVIVTHHTGSNNASEYKADPQAYFDRVNNDFIAPFREAGAHVVMLTTMSFAGLTQVSRESFRTILLAEEEKGLIDVVDFGDPAANAYPMWDQDAALPGSGSNTWFRDIGGHPNYFGHSLMAADVRAVLNRVIAREISSLAGV